MNNVIAFPSALSSDSSLVATVPAPAPQPINATDYKGTKQEAFEIIESPITGPYGTIEGKKGLFVNEKNINIVSNKYEIVQPNDVMQRFNEVAQASDLTINRTLLNPTNGGLMISALFETTKILGDDHHINLVFYTSHCGKYKTFLTLDTLRLACFNQVPALYKNKDRFIFAEKHYRNALDLNLVQETIANIPASVAAYNEKANILQDVRLSKADFVEWYIGQINLKETTKQFDSKVEQFKATYSQATGQGSLEDGTGWKALNAISFMNTHNGRNTANKAENTLLKGGDNTLKLMDSLLAFAG